MRPVHEFSIAQALADQVMRYAPEGARVREVEIQVGVMRGLEPEAMTMSWEAVTLDTAIAGCVLHVDLRPWTITCSECGRSWSSPVPFVDCECGNKTPIPVGSDELNLVSIVVDEDEAAEA
jgi:Zn finger protein HypA/HybF involved in hydrogenase expression